MIKPYELRGLDYQEVASNQSRYNSNMHTTKEFPNEVPPDLEPTMYRYWHSLAAETQGIPPADSHTLIIPLTTANLMLQVSPSTLLTGRINPSDEEDLLPAFQTLMTGLEGRPWFIRTDLSSPKDGKNRERPIITALDLLNRLMTSLRAIEGIRILLTDYSHLVINGVPIYLTPWDTCMDATYEWRVFCCPGTARVCAISQYKWPSPCPEEVDDAWIDRMVKGAMEVYGRIIERASESLMRQGFVFDLLCLKSGETMLVELNASGARSGCGSCLFHWVRDREVLCGDKEGVVVAISR